MIPLVQDNQAAIERLCQRYRVAGLEVFGSAAHGQFDEAHNDLDFFVEFGPLEPGRLADAYFGLLAELSRLFSRKGDLVTPKAIRNPYFLRAVHQTQRMLYAA